MPTGQPPECKAGCSDQQLPWRWFVSHKPVTDIADKNPAPSSEVMLRSQGAMTAIWRRAQAPRGSTHTSAPACLVLASHTQKRFLRCSRAVQKFIHAFADKLSLNYCSQLHSANEVWKEHQILVGTYCCSSQGHCVLFPLFVLQALIKQGSFSPLLAVATCALFSFLIIVGLLPTSCFSVCFLNPI